MSQIGKNIKKIRKVKNLSQSKFAELFDLSRASVGSYEEGRAEPKIEKLMDIAKYFSINLESLIQKDLSVNEISGFETVFNKENSVENNNLLSSSKSKQIDFVSKSRHKQYIDYTKLGKKWSKNIELPPNIDSRTEIAIEQYDNSMFEVDNGISVNDIILGYTIDLSQINKNYIYIVISKKEIHIRKVNLSEDTKLELLAVNKNFEPISIDKSDVIKVYRISGHIKNHINHFMS